MTDDPKPQEERAPEHSLGELEDRGIVAEIWDFMRVRKKFWLAPIILALVLLGMLFLVASQSGVVAPFIYAL